MSRLCIYSDQPVRAGAEPIPQLQTTDPELIASELAARGLRFERWATRAPLGAATPEAEILANYAPEITRVQAEGGYGTVDAISIHADHPERVSLRQKFLAEHTHAEDEVRFFVEGRGLFCIHAAETEEVLQVLCERNDWISVPAGTRHWFDMGAKPQFTALRFFNNSEGWVAQFTGDQIASRFPLLEP